MREYSTVGVRGPWRGCAGRRPRELAALYAGAGGPPPRAGGKAGAMPRCRWDMSHCERMCLVRCTFLVYYGCTFVLRCDRRPDGGRRGRVHEMRHAMGCANGRFWRVPCSPRAHIAHDATWPCRTRRDATARESPAETRREAATDTSDLPVESQSSGAPALQLHHSHGRFASDAFSLSGPRMMRRTWSPLTAKLMRVAHSEPAAPSEFQSQ